MEISEGAYTLAGVVLGAIATQLTAWLGSRQADQRVIKEALYTLLELHGLLTALVRLQNWMPSMATALRKQFPAAPPLEYEQALDALLTRMLHEAMLPLVGQRLDDLQADYAATLLKLAAVDPVSAYRLRGRQNVLSFLPQAAASWQQVVTAHLGTMKVPWAETLAHFQQQLQPQQVAETRDSVGEVAQQLASQLDRRTRRQVAAVLAAPAPDETALLAEAEAHMQQATVALAHLVPQAGTV